MCKCGGTSTSLKIGQERQVGWWRQLRRFGFTGRKWRASDKWPTDNSSFNATRGKESERTCVVREMARSSTFILFPISVVVSEALKIHHPLSYMVVKNLLVHDHPFFISFLFSYLHPQKHYNRGKQKHVLEKTNSHQGYNCRGEAIFTEKPEDFSLLAS